MPRSPMVLRLAAGAVLVLVALALYVTQHAALDALGQHRDLQKALRSAGVEKPLAIREVAQGGVPGEVAYWADEESGDAGQGSAGCFVFATRETRVAAPVGAIITALVVPSFEGGGCFGAERAYVEESLLGHYLRAYIPIVALGLSGLLALASAARSLVARRVVAQAS